MKSIRKIIAGLTLVSTMLLAVACKKDDHDENGNDDEQGKRDGKRAVHL